MNDPRIHTVTDLDALDAGADSEVGEAKLPMEVGDNPKRFTGAQLGGGLNFISPKDTYTEADLGKFVIEDGHLKRINRHHHEGHSKSLHWHTIANFNDEGGGAGQHFRGGHRRASAVGNPDPVAGDFYVDTTFGQFEEYQTLGVTGWYDFDPTEEGEYWDEREVGGTTYDATLVGAVASDQEAFNQASADGQVFVNTTDNRIIMVTQYVAFEADETKYEADIYDGLTETFVREYETYPWAYSFRMQYRRVNNNEVFFSFGLNEGVRTLRFTNLDESTHIFLYLKTLERHDEFAIVTRDEKDTVYRGEIDSDFDEENHSIEILAPPNTATFLTENTDYLLEFTRAFPDIGVTEDEAEDAVIEVVENFATAKQRSTQTGELIFIQHTDVTSVIPADARFRNSPIHWTTEQDIEIYGSLSEYNDEHETSDEVHIYHRVDSGTHYLRFGADSGASESEKAILTDITEGTLIAVFEDDELTLLSRAEADYDSTNGVEVYDYYRQIHGYGTELATAVMKTTTPKSESRVNNNLPTILWQDTNGVQASSSDDLDLENNEIFSNYDLIIAEYRRGNDNYISEVIARDWWEQTINNYWSNSYIGGHYRLRYVNGARFRFHNAAGTDIRLFRLRGINL